MTVDNNLVDQADVAAILAEADTAGTEPVDSGIAAEAAARSAADSVVPSGGVAETGAPPTSTVFGQPAGPVATAPKPADGVRTASADDAARAGSFGQKFSGINGRGEPQFLRRNADDPGPQFTKDGFVIGADDTGEHGLIAQAAPPADPPAATPPAATPPAATPPTPPPAATPPAATPPAATPPAATPPTPPPAATPPAATPPAATPPAATPPTARSFPPRHVGPAGGAHAHHSHSKDLHPKDLARRKALGADHEGFEEAVNKQRDAHGAMRAAPGDAVAKAHYAKAKAAADRARADVDDIHGEPGAKGWFSYLSGALGLLTPLSAAVTAAAAMWQASKANPYAVANATIMGQEKQAQTARAVRRDEKKKLDAADGQLADKKIDRLAQAKATRDQAREQERAEGRKANASMFAKKGAGGEGENSMSRSGVRGRAAHQAELQDIIDRRNKNALRNV